MRNALFSLIVTLAALMPAAAHAQAETDRLREALRSATAQQRSLEDQRAALQAKLTEAERERDRLRGQIEASRAQAKDAEQAYLQAVKDFNDRIAERDDALEKWKSAYTEAATVARAKDAERAKFEKDASDFKASNKSCEDKNAKLTKVGNEVLTRYEKMNPLEALGVHEPLFGLQRVEHQNKVQDYRDKILDQKVKP
jgi:chromosome segregation ATPase